MIRKMKPSTNNSDNHKDVEQVKRSDARRTRKRYPDQNKLVTNIDEGRGDSVSSETSLMRLTSIASMPVAQNLIHSNLDSNSLKRSSFKKMDVKVSRFKSGEDETEKSVSKGECTDSSVLSQISSSDKPKRPRTAYNYFVRDQRSKLMEKHKSDTQDEVSEHLDTRNMSFVEIGKLIGKQWQAADDKTKAHYNELAKKDSERYQEEIREYYSRMRQQAIEKHLSVTQISYNNASKTSGKDSISDSEVGTEVSNLSQITGIASNPAEVQQNNGQFSISGNFLSSLSTPSSNLTGELQKQLSMAIAERSDARQLIFSLLSQTHNFNRRAETGPNDSFTNSTSTIARGLSQSSQGITNIRNEQIQWIEFEKMLAVARSNGISTTNPNPIAFQIEQQQKQQMLQHLLQQQINQQQMSVRNNQLFLPSPSVLQPHQQLSELVRAILPRGWEALSQYDLQQLVEHIMAQIRRSTE